MSIRNVLGFGSKFVLHKLGFDLRGTLDGTVEAPILDDLVEKAEAIPNREPDRDVIVLHPIRENALSAVPDRLVIGHDPKLVI